jgi:hypothetical protein
MHASIPTHIHTHICTTHSHTDMTTDIYITQTHTHTHTHTHTRTQKHSSAQHTHTHTHTHSDTHIHMHITPAHTHTRTYTRKHTLTQQLPHILFIESLCDRLRGCVENVPIRYSFSFPLLVVGCIGNGPSSVTFVSGFPLPVKTHHHHHAPRTQSYYRHTHISNHSIHYLHHILNRNDNIHIARC